MMSNKNKMQILTELPKDKRGSRILWGKTIGMIIEVYHEIYGNISFKVLDYYNENKISYIRLDYNGYILEDGIFIGGFLNGNIGAVMNITNSSKNTFHLDENNILHIYGENKNGNWEALYSGKHVKEVMNSTWYVARDKIRTNSFNFQGKSKSLHHIDIKAKPGFVIDHMVNEFNLIDKFYDCRIENLREVNQAENMKNKKCTNEWGYTGLRKYGKGWSSGFNYNETIIVTKVKRDLNEAILDNLITQIYLGYKHQEKEFYKLNELSEDRIKEVTDLLNEKIKKADNKTHKIKEYKYNIEEKDDHYILRKNGCEMLFNCDLNYIKDKNVYPVAQSNGVYWSVSHIQNNKKIQNRFHRDIFGLKPNEYSEYKIHIDHLNGNPSDNRFENLVITTHYGNMCNTSGIGYSQRKTDIYEVSYMRNYKYWNLIGGIKLITFKTEQEAIQEVNRRKSIIENVRVKLKSKQELDELIQYCLDNNYLQENGLADLDLGYLYWKCTMK